MTVREFIEMVDHRPLLAGLFLGLPPVMAFLCGRLHARGNGGAAPWKYIYSVLVYAVCVPGIFAVMLTAYTMFFSKENLLDASLLVYFAPIVSMIVTLALIRQRVSFDEVPGFDRLSGLMVMLACSFAIALGIDKTRIWIWFGGSIEQLFAVALGAFALIKWGAYMLFRSSEEPAQKAPTSVSRTPPTGPDGKPIL